MVFPSKTAWKTRKHHFLAVSIRGAHGTVHGGVWGCSQGLKFYKQIFLLKNNIEQNIITNIDFSKVDLQYSFFLQSVC